MPGFKPSPFNWIDSLPADSREILGREFVPVVGPAGDIYSPSSKARGIYRVEAGCAFMYLLSPEGRRVLLKRYEPGEVFGEVATLDRQHYPVFVSSGKGARFSFIRFDRVDTLRRTDARIDAAIVAAVCRMTRALLTMLASATIDNAHERVWARLVWMLESQPGAREAGSISISQLELADMLGLSRQTVNEVLRELQSWGQVQLMRGRILVRPDRKVGGPVHNQASVAATFGTSHGAEQQDVA